MTNIKTTWQQVGTLAYLLGYPRNPRRIENEFTLTLQGPVEENRKIELLAELVSYLNNSELRAKYKDTKDRLHARGKYIEDDDDEVIDQLGEKDLT